MTLSIDSAILGLKVAQQALDTVSKNISNASTVGYTRKILPQENLIIAGQGVGARGLAQVRNVNTALIADLNKQTGVTEAYNVRLKYLQRIQDFHGASDSGRALSSQLTALQSAFTSLSSAPDDAGMLGKALSAAQQVATSVNNFSNLLTQMRSDTESDISSAVNDVNTALTAIANLNQTIGRMAATGQSTADLEDQRDVAVKTVAKYMNIATYKNGTTLVVTTRQGQALADSAAHPLVFQKSTMLPDSYYPGGNLQGLHIGTSTGPDITQADLGGQLGALFEMRDTTLPQYQAQLDEFAQQLATRFSNEGLKLFVGPNNDVPPNDPNSSIPTGYVGFSGQIKINPLVAADPTLIRSGTNGGTELPGSNEVIRRIAQFAFGAYQSQKAEGTLDISGVTPLTQNAVGTVDLSAYVSSDFASGPLAGATLPGSFTIAVGGGSPQTINVVGTDTALSLVNKINAALGSTVASFDGTNISLDYAGAITLADGGFGLASIGLSAGTTTPVLPVAPRNTVAGNVNIASYATLGQVPNAPTLPGTFTVTIGGVPKTITVNAGDTAAGLVSNINAAFGYTVASVNTAGAISFGSTSDIGIAAGSINAAGLAALGMTAGTTAQPNPSFKLQVGTRTPVEITILPGDNAAALVNKINATVPGMTASLNVDGELVLTPSEGGDIALTDGVGSPLAALGMTVSNVAQGQFGQTGLGASGSITSGLMANSTLIDYISNIISTQGEQFSVTEGAQAQENSFLQTLQSRNDNTSGVNIDQEMADLIRIQSAYSAAAKMISAAQQIFDDLLNSIR